MRPKKDEAKAEAEARKCAVEAEAAVSNESCNIITFILHIIYHKTDISQTELT